MYETATTTQQKSKKSKSRSNKNNKPRRFATAPAESDLGNNTAALGAHDYQPASKLQPIVQVNTADQRALQPKPLSEDSTSGRSIPEYGPGPHTDLGLAVMVHADEPKFHEAPQSPNASTPNEEAGVPIHDESGFTQAEPVDARDTALPGLDRAGVGLEDDAADSPSTQLWYEMPPRLRDEQLPHAIEPQQLPNHHMSVKQDQRGSVVSDQAQLHSAVAPTKRRKSKNSGRKSTPSTRQAILPPSDSDANEYLQMAAYKMDEKKKKLTATLETEREEFRVVLQQIAEEKLSLQEQLNIALEQKSSLNAVIRQQQQKMRTYESRVGKFKTFVDGLGNDVSALRQESSVARHNTDDLAKEAQDRKAEQADICRRISDCVERSTKLRDQAFKALQDVQPEMQGYRLKINYLEQQLSERVGLLAEERDRRSQLEKQMASAVSSDETLQRTLKENHGAALNKLSEIHASLDESNDMRVLIERVEQALVALQGLNSQQIANSDVILSIKTLVESLSKRYASS